jgi:hypothetical protein
MNFSTENSFDSACLFCISVHLLHFHAVYKYVVFNAEMPDKHRILIVISSVQINDVFARRWQFPAETGSNKCIVYSGY